MNRIIASAKTQNWFGIGKGSVKKMKREAVKRLSLFEPALG